MNTMMPVIREFIDAPDAAARARILLACPDMIVARYRDTLLHLSENRNFEEGVTFLIAHRAAAHGVRGLRGELSAETQGQLDEARRVLAALAGAPPPSIEDPASGLPS